MTPAWGQLKSLVLVFGEGRHMPQALIKQIDHDVVVVSDFLASKLNVPFRIPLFQRGYAWEEEQVTDFVKDLVALLGRLNGRAPKDARNLTKLIEALSTSSLDVPAPAEGSTASPSSVWHEDYHFFGAVLTIEQTAPGSVADRYFELVDGQQRVTTFVLTLELLRRAFVTLAALEPASPVAMAAMSQATGLAQILTISPPSWSGPSEQAPRLTLSKDDDDYFRHLLANSARKAGPKSNERLEAASRTLEAGLTAPILSSVTLPAAAKASLLRQIQEALLYRCFIVHMNTSERSIGYRLFMILNDRGQPLAVSDLLRTRSLELLEGHETRQDHVAQAWRTILRPGTAAADAYLRDLYAATAGLRAPSKDLFDKLDETFMPTDGVETVADADGLVAVVDDFEAEQRIHAKIVAGEWPYDPLPNEPRAADWSRSRLTRLIKSLRLLASIPLLLSVVATGRSEKEFEEVVLYLEKVAFRYTVAGGHAGTLGEKLFEQAGKVRQDSSHGLSEIKTELRDTIARQASDDALRPRVRTRMRYNVSPALIKYLLTTLDDHWPWWKGGASGPMPTGAVSVFDLGRVNIEHIYPQTPLPGNEVLALDPLKDHLGNLTFWYDEHNQKASNKAYKDKKAMYVAEHNVAMTQALGTRASNSWTSRDIASREEDLVNLTMRVFEVPGADGVVTSPIDTDYAEVPARPRAWFAQQNSDSVYRDIPGRAYDFPPSIANASQIVVGDVIVTYLRGKGSEEDKRITGVGRVGQLLSGGSGLIAVYDRFRSFDPPLTFESIGDDPRTNRRNSINQLDADTFGALLAAAQLASIEEAEGVEVEIADLLPELVDA